MIKCEYCDREFKSNAGLVMHQKKCKPKDEPIAEEVEPIVEVTNSVVSDEKIRLLDKLKMTIKMCYDGATKHRLEKEYVELGGDLKDLRK